MSDRPRALVVEDDDRNRLLLQRFLSSEGYHVVEAHDGPTALQVVTTGAIDVVVLDLGLPGLDGLEVLRRIRRGSGVPVLVLTGRDDEHAVLGGFDAGADDYVVKPYSLSEVAARLRALLRRGEPMPESERIEDDGLVIDMAGAEATLHGEPLELTPKELALLGFLAGSPQRCFSREELLHHVWGSTSDWQDSATVTEHVRRLRRKVEEDPGRPCRIETVRGRGYRYSPRAAILRDS